MLTISTNYGCFYRDLILKCFLREFMAKIIWKIYNLLDKERNLNFIRDLSEYGLSNFAHETQVHFFKIKMIKFLLSFFILHIGITSFSSVTISLT